MSTSRQRDTDVEPSADDRPPATDPPADARGGPVVGRPAAANGAADATARRATPAAVARPPLSAGGRLPGGAAWIVGGVVAALTLLADLSTDVNRGLLVVGAVLVTAVAVYAWARVVEDGRRAKDRLVTVGVVAAFALAIAPLVSLLYTVVQRGAARMDGAFFTESMRGVVGEGGGAFHAITGTLIITGVASLASVPIGIMAAIYLHEYGKGRLKRALTFFVDVMTGIPSIVAGLFAYALFVIFFGPGVRLGVMGAVALAVLMIPIVVRSTEEMLRVVPNGLRESSLALGVPKWRTITKVVLPTAFSGIVSGVMIAVARVIGETAPLLITTGAFTSTNFNPFDGRMANLPVFTFNQYGNPGVPKDPYIERAWAAALTLMLVVMVLFLVARLISARFGVKTR